MRRGALYADGIADDGVIRNENPPVRDISLYDVFPYPIYNIQNRRFGAQGKESDNMVKVQGIGNAGAEVMENVRMSGNSDAQIKSIERQIAAAQKELQELSSNKELSMEQKMERRKEINQQIMDLQNQLRARQIELRRERQQTEGATMEELSGGKRAQGEADGGVSVGISKAGMEAMISADTAMNQAGVLGQVKNKLEGQADILKSEIATDGARGANVEDKEKALADLEQRAETAGKDQIESLAQAGREIAETNSSAEESDRKETQKDGDSAEPEKSGEGQKGTEAGAENRGTVDVKV